VLGHELRNPLAPLRTGLELLAEARTRPELTPSVLEMMERQVGHLVHLVDDLLDVSRITRGDIHLQAEVLDLRTIVDAAVDLARPLIDERCHELSFERVAEPLLVFGDFQRLTQVLANLLGNAAKYTDPGGKIRVGIEADEGHAVVRIADTGFGIPPDRLEEVFGMFRRIREHRARLGGGGGLGVGLALSRQLVELHNGTIEAASEGLGRGSEFTVRLPLWRKHAPITPDAGRDAHRADAWRVLVVDDNVDAAESLRALLQLQGHEARAGLDEHLTKPVDYARLAALMRSRTA
jgi:signal transduction histidine kinase